MAYVKRFARIMTSHSYDLLWIEKELFPWFPAWTERALAGLGVRYVVDYDDAVFHRYDLHRSPLIRSVLGKSIDTVMRHAHSVVVGNDYLAERARHAWADRVEVLPSVVDIYRYSLHEKKGEQFRIGWIGSPVTAPYLELIREALEEANRSIDARLVLVGARILKSRRSNPLMWGLCLCALGLLRKGSAATSSFNTWHVGFR
jgi:hypothetical protein